MCRGRGRRMDDAVASRGATEAEQERERGLAGS